MFTPVGFFAHGPGLINGRLMLLFDIISASLMIRFMNFTIRWDKRLSVFFPASNGISCKYKYWFFSFFSGDNPFRENKKEYGNP